tara:strand:- start:64 stop:309 length:246 start_codon:yes stop_codon:yes gene_type:complete
MFSDIKKPPVRNSKEADAVVALRPHFPMGYHLAQLQVGGTSVLSNAMLIVLKKAKNFNLKEGVYLFLGPNLDHLSTTTPNT